jgi:REP element-mobilizing transposase RayT
VDVIFPRNPLYFVTCCTYRRRLYLANDDVHASFIKFAQRAQIDFGIAVGRYVILPDHLHLFVALPDDVRLGDWVGALKRVLARTVKTPDSSDPVWQRGFFDHLLRSCESYSRSGITCGKIPFASVWSPRRMIGHTVARSSPSTMRRSDEDTVRRAAQRSAATVLALCDNIPPLHPPRCRHIREKCFCVPRCQRCAFLRSRRPGYGRRRRCCS